MGINSFQRVKNNCYFKIVLYTRNRSSLCMRRSRFQLMYLSTLSGIQYLLYDFNDLLTNTLDTPRMRKKISDGIGPAIILVLKLNILMYSQGLLT